MEKIDTDYKQQTELKKFSLNFARCANRDKLLKMPSFLIF